MGDQELCGSGYHEGGWHAQAGGAGMKPGATHGRAVLGMLPGQPMRKRH